MSRLLAVLSSMALIAAAFLVVEGLPAIGVSVQRRQASRNSNSQASRNSNSRRHCQTRAQGSCSFYSSCIEPQMPCGPNGFILSYALKRCNAIINLEHSCGNDSCLTLDAVNWIHTSEQCFQENLSALLESYRERLSDPHTCLDWEKAAIEKMNACYNITTPRNGKTVLDLSNSNLTVLVNTVRVETVYYDSVVNDGIPKILMSNNKTELAAELISRPLKHRTIICIKGAKYLREKTEVQPSPEDYVGAVGFMLKLPHNDDLHYGGEDPDEDGLCRANQPKSINVFMYQYHLVTWFTSENTHKDMGAPSIMYPTPEGAHFSGRMYELTAFNDSSKSPRIASQCGDGKRQATETCDYSFDNYKSCTFECEVRESYDCNMGRLNHSRCSKEMCGDGLRTRGELCDDGNTKDGDGCSSTCGVETITHTCTQVYNRTSSCTRLAAADKAKPLPPARLISSDPIAVHNQNMRTLDSPTTTTTNAGFRPLAPSISIIITLVLGLLSVISLR